MPSESPSWLRSQGLGVVCGLSSAVLLAVGSVVLAATRDGASASVQLDELSGFFAPPRWEHSWLYALLGVLALYALNTALCTWDSVMARLRRGTVEPSSWAPTVIHVSWLVALLAHLVGGVGNQELDLVTLTSNWSQLDDAEWRLLTTDSELSSTGKVKQTWARLERRTADGVTAVSVGFNVPFTRGGGADLLVFAREASAPVVVVRGGDQSCATAVPGECVLGPSHLEVVGAQPAGERWVALIRTTSDRFPLAVGGSHEVEGRNITLESLRVEPVVQLRHRHTPGHPIALAAGVLLALGLLLMGRRWLRPPVLRETP